MKNYSIGIADGARTEFHQTLGLTGAEVSFNSLPAGEAYHLFIRIKKMRKYI